MGRVVKLNPVEGTEGCAFALPGDARGGIAVFRNGLLQCPSEYTVNRKVLVMHDGAQSWEEVHVLMM